MKIILLVVAALFLNGCSSLDVAPNYKSDILYDQANKGQLKKEEIYGCRAYSGGSLNALYGSSVTADASLYESASTNYSKYFEVDTDLYGAVWICLPEQAFEKFHAISQAIFFAPEINMLQFGIHTNFVESVDLLKAGKVEYYVASNADQSFSGKEGKKLSLYMIGNDAYIELTIGPRDFDGWLTQAPTHPGTLYRPLKAKLGNELREQQIAREEKEKAERKQKEENARRQKESEALARLKREEAEQQQKEEASKKAEKEKWDKYAQEQRIKQAEEQKRRDEAAIAATLAKEKAVADRIAKINSRVKAANSSYYFQGRSAFDFLRATLIENRSIPSQIGEVFELKESQWEVIQCDAKAVLVYARSDRMDYDTKSQRILDNSYLMIARKKGADPLIEGQSIRGFIILLGTQKYTTVLGAQKTVPLFQLLEE